MRIRFSPLANQVYPTYLFVSVINLSIKDLNLFSTRRMGIINNSFSFLP